MHGGLMHIIFNMGALAVVGSLLEPILGRTKFLIIYIALGILASCASIYWFQATISVGASGAVFGLYGMLLIFLLTKLFNPAFNKVFLTYSLIFIAFNLIIGFTGGIDYAAHIGGLLGGMFVGLILRYSAWAFEIPAEQIKS
ncbi:rhomboid family intramembrane serine protease [Pedobacter immunditicola]|uniref:rhomboid family intramembrane serine protease n=1 Tax=Pedobacter immunditicola TaxID=3133440 RepID=UPI0030AC87CE